MQQTDTLISCYRHLHRASSRSSVGPLRPPRSSLHPRLHHRTRGRLSRAEGDYRTSSLCRSSSQTNSSVSLHCQSDWREPAAKGKPRSVIVELISNGNLTEPIAFDGQWRTVPTGRRSVSSITSTSVFGLRADLHRNLSPSTRSAYNTGVRLLPSYPYDYVCLRAKLSLTSSSSIPQAGPLRSPTPSSLNLYLHGLLSCSSEVSSNFLFRKYSSDSHLRISSSPDLLTRLKDLSLYSASKHGAPNQLLINEYLPGQGIDVSPFPFRPGPHLSN
jgi:hypothetical protein